MNSNRLLQSHASALQKTEDLGKYTQNIDKAFFDKCDLLTQSAAATEPKKDANLNRPSETNSLDYLSELSKNITLQAK